VNNYEPGHTLGVRHEWLELNCLERSGRLGACALVWYVQRFVDVGCLPNQAQHQFKIIRAEKFKKLANIIFEQIFFIGMIQQRGESNLDETAMLAPLPKTTVSQ